MADLGKAQVANERINSGDAQREREATDWEQVALTNMAVSYGGNHSHSRVTVMR